MGRMEGAREGDALGRGVGDLGTNVGLSVGETVGLVGRVVGLKEGRGLGCGVGGLWHIKEGPFPIVMKPRSQIQVDCPGRKVALKGGQGIQRPPAIEYVLGAQGTH